MPRKGEQMREMELALDFATRQLHKQRKKSEEKEAAYEAKLRVSRQNASKLIAAFKTAKLAKDALDMRLSTETRRLQLLVRSTTAAAEAAEAHAQEEMEELMEELALSAVALEDLRADLATQKRVDAELVAGKAAAEAHSAALAEELAQHNARSEADTHAEAQTRAEADLAHQRVLLETMSSGDREAEVKLAWQVVAARKLLVQQLDMITPGGMEDEEVEEVEGHELDSLIGLFVERMAAAHAAKTAATVAKMEAHMSQAEAAAAQAELEAEERKHAASTRWTHVAAAARESVRPEAPEEERYPTTAHVDYAAARRRAQRARIMSTDGSRKSSSSNSPGGRGRNQAQRKLRSAYDNASLGGRRKMVYVMRSPDRSPPGSEKQRSPQATARTRHINSVEVERQRAIRRENMRLLEKIEKTLSPSKAEQRRGSSHSRSRSPAARPGSSAAGRPRSLSPSSSEVNRKREAERIARDNVKIMHGIMTASPAHELKSSTWKAADKQHQSYLSNLARRSFKASPGKVGGGRRGAR